MLNRLEDMSINSLFSRIEGYAALYIQTGNEQFRNYVQEAKAEIVRRVEVRESK